MLKADDVLTAFFSRLPFYRTGGDRFYQGQDPTFRRPWTVTEKAPQGTVFPLEGGLPVDQVGADYRCQRWRVVGGPTQMQWAAILQTSSSALQAADRLRKLVFEGIDTTVPLHERVDLAPAAAAPAVDTKALAEQITANVLAAVQGKLEEVQKGQLHLDALVKQVTDAALQSGAEVPEEAEPLHVAKKGLQQKPKKESPAQAKARLAAEAVLWDERCRQMGEDPLPKLPNGQIDKRSLRFAEARWAKHVEAIPAEAQ